jgi:hypothetical protein
VGTTAGPLEGSLCVARADSVPAFIFKKRCTHYLKIKCRYPLHCSSHLSKNNTYAKSATSFPLTILSILVALVVNSAG